MKGALFVEEKRFTLRMDGELFQKISLLAEKNRRSVAKEIEWAIAKHLGSYGKIVETLNVRFANDLLESGATLISQVPLENEGILFCFGIAAGVEIPIERYDDYLTDLALRPYSGPDFDKGEDG